MTTNDSGDFDPRFDPAFQRGFDGTEPRGRRQSRADASRARADDDSRGSSRSLTDRLEASPPQAPAAPSAAPVTPADASPPELLDAPGGVNPFILALAVVSVALVAGGVWGVQAAREPFLRTDAAVDVDYSGLQMLMTFAPMSIALGLATAVGILFLYAVRWRRRR